jgi:hypothetical protein
LTTFGASCPKTTRQREHGLGITLVARISIARPVLHGSAAIIKEFISSYT